jgi:hypothetical protein
MESIMDEAAVSNTSEEADKVHHWRICPIGKHYVNLIPQFLEDARFTERRYSY